MKPERDDIPRILCAGDDSVLEFSVEIDSTISSIEMVLSAKRPSSRLETPLSYLMRRQKQSTCIQRTWRGRDGLAEMPRGASGSSRP